MINKKMKIEELIKIFRLTNKSSYNIDIIYLDSKKYEFNIKGDFMQTSKKLTLEDLALIVNDGFKNVNARLDKVDARLDKVDVRLDKVDARLDNIEKDVAEIKNCPTIKTELNLLNHNN